MKYILIFFCLGCTKIDSDMIAKKSSMPLQHRSAFPTRVFLGNDTIMNYTNMVRFLDYDAYLNVCNPQEQQFGVDVYQIEGPTQGIFTWFYYSYKQCPAFDGLVPGKYGFVAHAYVTGYSFCDDSTFNDHVYDTCWVTILKRRRKVKP